ncbi:MAG: peroxiredoxin [Pseudomonadota bacterium]
MVEIGSAAPDFTLPRDGGDMLTLSALRPKTVVLYFYPKDDTSGCTKEALAFTSLAAEFTAAGAEIIGISKDTVAKHDKFIAKHDLGVILVSDADSDVCESYGTWVEKSMYGKKYMGIERSTFVIGGDGTVTHAWRKVKVPGHAEAVLEAVKGG